MPSTWDYFSAARKVDGTDFGQEFGQFKTSARRIELLTVYRVPQEREALTAFLERGSVESRFNADWHKILRGATKRGAHVSRVRVVPLHPTEYLQFEITVGYAGNVDLGERISFVFDDEFNSLIEEGLPKVDFWLFDDERLYLIVYDARGAFLGTLQMPTDYTRPFASLFAAALNVSRSMEWALNDYLVHPLGSREAN